MLKNLVLSGGAIKGFSFIGVIRFLEERNVMKYFETFIGSSAGSLVCLFLSLGMSSIEIEETCMDILTNYIKEPIDLNCVLNLNETLGIDNGNIVVQHLKSICKKQFDDDNINFINLMKKTGNNLVVCASNLSTRIPTYFSADTTPLVHVIDAIRASITIPFIFTPKLINGNIYVDAGVFDNFPIEFVRKFVSKDTLGVMIQSKPYKPATPLNILSYFWLMIDSMLDRINMKDVVNENIAILEIDVTNEESFNIDFNTMKLNIDIDKISGYVSKGYESASSSKVNQYLIDGHFVKTSKNDDVKLSISGKKEMQQNLNRNDHTWVQIPPLIPNQSYKLNNLLSNVFSFEDS